MAVRKIDKDIRPEKDNIRILRLFVDISISVMESLSVQATIDI